MTRTLILGGARSGKSGYAERLASETGHPVVYIATGEARDAEMQARIATHRDRRNPAWTTVETPIALAKELDRWARPGQTVIVDCLTVWLGNLLFSGGADYPEVGPITAPAAFAEQRAALLGSLAAAHGDVILVSNEVGMGIVPMGAVSRWFVDEAGRLNQDVAAVCDRVVFVAAGLPLVLKGA